jgi:uncharacterized protein (TIGR02594 family)
MRRTISQCLLISTATVMLVSAADARPHHSRQVTSNHLVSETMLPSERFMSGSFHFEGRQSRQVRRAHRSHRHAQRSYHRHRHVSRGDAGTVFALTKHAERRSASGNSIVAIAKSQIGNGAVYGRRDLWCARFMNWVVEKAGYKGTGSDLAFSFARFGRRINHAVVGAIAYMGRGRGGGHVGVVSNITKDGNPVIISGNHGRRVAESVYPARRIAGYVVP